MCSAHSRRWCLREWVSFGWSRFKSMHWGKFNCLCQAFPGSWRSRTEKRGMRNGLLLLKSRILTCCHHSVTHWMKAKRKNRHGNCLEERSAGQKSLEHQVFSPEWGWDWNILPETSLFEHNYVSHCVYVVVTNLSTQGGDRVNFKSLGKLN